MKKRLVVFVIGIVVLGVVGWGLLWYFPVKLRSESLPTPVVTPLAPSPSTFLYQHPIILEPKQPGVSGTAMREVHEYRCSMFIEAQLPDPPMGRFWKAVVTDLSPTYEDRLESQARKITSLHLGRLQKNLSGVHTLTWSEDPCDRSNYKHFSSWGQEVTIGLEPNLLGEKPVLRGYFKND